MVATQFWTISFFLLLSMACGRPGESHSQLDEAWNIYNNPQRMASQYVVNMGSLPIQGSVSQPLWSDTYWPSNKGGLAHRWASRSGGNGWSYGLNNFQTVQRMSPQQIAALSPAEKYDILRGDDRYTLTDYERKRNAASQPNWAGLCHGWAAATIHFPAEPGPVTLRSPIGVDVPFGAADVKGLLALVQQYNRSANDFIGVGQRCNATGGYFRNPYAISSQPECRDVNPGAFHIILANYLGLQRKAFIADVAESAEVWNFPIHTYYTRVEGVHPFYSNAAPGTAQIIRVQTTIQYAGLASAEWQRTGMRLGQRQYRYTLELDRAGNIVGGEWLDAVRPDFLWLQTGPTFGADYLGGIQEVYRASIAR